MCSFRGGRRNWRKKGEKYWVKKGKRAGVCQSRGELCPFATWGTKRRGDQNQGNRLVGGKECTLLENIIYPLPKQAEKPGGKETITGAKTGKDQGNLMGDM